ncbi:MAG: LON peptidase substrate-binding domain-containing protein [Anaerolineales bacterium]|jgi:Lon protease-like protein
MSRLLPLFPLKSVLFPGTPIQLQIFEPRYKEMLRVCMAHDHSFGVVLIKHGSEAFGPMPEPYLVGCRAVVREVQSLPEGRSRLFALGHERFRITSIAQAEPYLVGCVEYDALNDNPDPGVGSVAANVAGRMLRYTDILSESGRDIVDLSNLPADPYSLAYRICSVLQIPLTEKQSLLEMDSLVHLFRMLERILERELALMPAMLAEGPLDGIGPFGWN